MRRVCYNLPAIRFILTEYVEQAMAHAVYDKLEDGTFAGRIPPCKGVVALGSTLRECADELRSTLEDWILVGLKLGHPFIGRRITAAEWNELG